MRNLETRNATRKRPRPRWSDLASHLTPQERKALLLASALFVLGVLVRWLRLSRLR